MNAQVHHLKTDPVFFEYTRKGLKTYEVRPDNVNFNADDILILDEYDSLHEAYTGRSIARTVTYVQIGPSQALLEGWCIMGLK